MTPQTPSQTSIQSPSQTLNQPPIQPTRTTTLDAAARAAKPRYNLVLLPLNDLSGAAKRFQLSAGCPGLPRMVSTPWSRAEVHAALTTCGLTVREVDELFRGNRMAFGGRNTAYLFLNESQLLAMGLTFAPDPEPSDPPVILSSIADVI